MAEIRIQRYHTVNPAQCNRGFVRATCVRTVVAAFVLALTAVSYAQTVAGPKWSPPIRMIDVELESVFERFFKGCGQDFLIDIEVKGRVSIDLPRMPYLRALSTLCHAFGVKVDLHDRISFVRLGEEEAPPGSFLPNFDLERPAAPLSFSRKSVHFVLAEFCKRLKIPFVISKEVKGVITGDLPSMPAEQMLRLLLSGVDATYRIERGILFVIERQY